jgi:hypothetical protein
MFRCLAFCLAGLILARQAYGDGDVVPPRDYEGSLEERAQEAIIVFHGSDEPGGSIEDLILKISVAGEVDHFAWVVPFPPVPEAFPEESELFAELFAYVERRPAACRGAEVPRFAARIHRLASAQDRIHLEASRHSSLFFDSYLTRRNRTNMAPPSKCVVNTVGGGSPGSL